MTARDTIARHMTAGHMTARLARVGGAALTVASLACNGTTGDALVTFSAYAQGAPNASQPFTEGAYLIALTRAQMHLGAVYVDQAPLATGAEGPGCINPGVYAAQVPGPVEADLLNSGPQEFTVLGNGTADVGVSWEIWLTDGDVNGTNGTPMVQLQGVATRVADNALFSFGAIVTINDNRVIPASDPSQPGLNPICKQRIIQIGGIHIPFFQGGTLAVTIDPRAWFHPMPDFATLPSVCDPTFLPSRCVENANCQFGGATGDADADYGTGQSCRASSDCAGGFVCDTASEACVAQYCIPDTNFAVGPGATQGQLLYTGIRTGGAAAYSIQYSP